MTNPTPPEPDAKPTAAPAPGKPGVFVATKSFSVFSRSADTKKVEPPRMTEDTRRTPEQIAQRISGEFAAITEACPDQPHCYVCADCEVKLEEAIAAALAEQDAEIAALRKKNSCLEAEKQSAFEAYDRESQWRANSPCGARAGARPDRPVERGAQGGTSV